MSLLWLVPILLGVVVICVVGVLDTSVHHTDRRVRDEADALASLADEAASLAPLGSSESRWSGSGSRSDRH